MTSEETVSAAEIDADLLDEFPTDADSAREKVLFLLEVAQVRLANGVGDTEFHCPRRTEAYNVGLRNAAKWWLTATEAERIKKRERVRKREQWLTTLLLKPPQIGVYNAVLGKRVRRYEGWCEVFTTVKLHRDGGISNE